MKRLFIAVLVTALSILPVFAKWAPLPLKQLIESSDSIVLAEFISEDSRAEKGQRIDQEVTLKVISAVKGETAQKIEVVGFEDRALCVPQFVFPTKRGVRYLVFLQKREGKYTIVNGIFGALTIIDEQVNWFTDETKIQGMQDRKMTSHKLAITSIKKTQL